MLEQIRESVFETNSSSMHSLVILNTEDYETDADIYYTVPEVKSAFKYKVKNNKIKADNNENWYFGRHPFRILETIYDKFTYAFASMVYSEGDEMLTDPGYVELLEFIQEYFPNVDRIVPPEDSYFGTDDKILSRCLSEKGISLKEFLLNKKYLIICDGDEYCFWEDLKKIGIVNTNAFEEI